MRGGIAVAVGIVMTIQRSILAGLLLAACSSNVTTPDTPDAGVIGADPVAFADLYGKVAAAYCDRVFACCDMNEAHAIGVIPYTDSRPDIPDAAACTTYMTTWIQSQGLLSAISHDVGSGAVDYDAQRAGDCLASMTTMACDAFGHDVSGFRDMRACSPFVANKASGDACAWDQQCPTEYCTSPDAGGDPVCRDKPALGAQCPVGVCDGDNYCDFNDGTCKAPLANGADCVFDDYCTSGWCSYDNSTGDTGICSVAETWLCDGP